jgi:Smg protein
MNENVLDILMYLFENYFAEPSEEDPDQGALETELLEAGFTEPNVRKAFTWLESLADRQAGPMAGSDGGPAATSTRVLTEEEARRISPDARGFLLFLEETGVVGPATRELVMDRIMALDGEEVDTEALSWILLMVLHNQPGQEGAYVWVEDMIFDRLDGVYH